MLPFGIGSPEYIKKASEKIIKENFARNHILIRKGKNQGVTRLVCSLIANHLFKDDEYKVLIVVNGYGYSREIKELVNTFAKINTYTGNTMYVKRNIDNVTAISYGQLKRLVENELWRVEEYDMIVALDTTFLSDGRATNLETVIRYGFNKDVTFIIVRQFSENPIDTDILRCNTFDETTFNRYFIKNYDFVDKNIETDNDDD